MTSAMPHRTIRRREADRSNRAWLNVAAAVAALASAVAAGATSPAAASAHSSAAPAVNAAVCEQVFALLPMTMPTKDVSLGSVNGSSLNAPLGARDSGGLSRAELWVKKSISVDGSMILQNVNTDAGTFAAATGGNLTGAPAVTKLMKSSDSTQRWTEEGSGSGFRYRASNGLYLTFVSGSSSKPYQMHGNGQGGGQYFKKVLGGCN